jgi:hypothetical protein
MHVGGKNSRDVQSHFLRHLEGLSVGGHQGNGTVVGHLALFWGARSGASRTPVVVLVEGRSAGELMRGKHWCASRGCGLDVRRGANENDRAAQRGRVTVLQK